MRTVTMEDFGLVTPVPLFRVPDYGDRVGIDNAVFVQSLRNLTDCRGDRITLAEMAVGQRVQAHFQSGFGHTHCEIERVA